MILQPQRREARRKSFNTALVEIHQFIEGILRVILSEHQAEIDAVHQKASLIQ
jgi:hypothetical protein